MMRHDQSQNMSQTVAPLFLEMPSKLQAIRENGELMGLPFALQGKTWAPKSAKAIRDRLLTVTDKKDVAAFLVYSGYVVMLEMQWGTKPEDQIKPKEVSDTLMAYVAEWRDACREILTNTYRYPAKPKEESDLGHGSVRALARRGTGRFNEVPVSFTWDASGKPRLTLRPATTLEAVVLSCHLDKVAGWKFRQCPMCERVFEMTDPRKRFCSNECAHLAVVRRGRKSARPYPALIREAGKT